MKKLEDKARAAIESLLESVPCCECCGGKDGYKEAVRAAAAILGFKVEWREYPNEPEGIIVGALP